jgi:Fe-S-cluster-containing hydrogenase component 2
MVRVFKQFENSITGENMKKIIVSDINQCNGCRMCEMVCSLAQEGQFNPSASKIRIFKNEACGIDIPIIDSSCNLCQRCVKYCPTRVLQCVDVEPEEFHVLDKIRKVLESDQVTKVG